MDEYIEREALKERFRKRIKWLKKDVHDQYSLGLFHGCEYDTDLINEPPAADVAPVQHGRWIFGKDLTYSWGQIPKNKYHLYCSKCLEQAFNRSDDNDPDFDVDTSYCPNCGAKMDGGNGD